MGAGFGDGVLELDWINWDLGLAWISCFEGVVLLGERVFGRVF